MKKILFLLLLLLLPGCKKASTVINDYDYTSYRMASESSHQFMPTKGNVNVLVIPVKFKDKSVEKYDLYDLGKAFNGSSSQTAWESVKSYFDKSSYHNLNITATVTDWFETVEDYSVSKIEYDKGYNPVAQILIDALTYFEDSYDYSLFDSDNDQYIDSVYLMYNEEPQVNGNSLLWSWKASFTDSNRWDNCKVYPYVWASFNEIYKANDYSPSEKINSSVLIHETGHLLGAYDYYDSDTTKGANCGIGRYDMMFANVADFNSTTKMLFDWKSPTIISSGTNTFEINPFSTSGDSIIVCPNFDDNIYREFFIIDFYNFDGINGDYSLLDYRYKLNKVGIRIYHVNATLQTTNRSDYIPYQDIVYDNQYTNHAFIELVEKNSPTEFLESLELWNVDCLFTKGEVFEPNKECSEYLDSSLLNFKISILDVGKTAKIKISIK